MLSGPSKISRLSGEIGIVSGFIPDPAAAMQIAPETSASTFFGLITLGVAASGGVVDAAAQGDGLITLSDHARAFFAGLVGGFLFLRAASLAPRPLRWPERLMALFTSAIWGAMFAPGMTAYVTMQAPALKSGGPLLVLPAAAAIGAFMPMLFGLTTAAVEAARRNPQSVTDFIATLRNIRSGK